MLRDQLLRSLQDALKAKQVDADIRAEKEILVPMEFMPLVYGDIEAFESKAKVRKMSVKKTIEMIEGKEYEVIEPVA